MARVITKLRLKEFPLSAEKHSDSRNGETCHYLLFPMRENLAGILRFDVSVFTELHASRSKTCGHKLYCFVRNFVMSKIARRVGMRELGPAAPVDHKLPREVVAEAIR